MADRASDNLGLSVLVVAWVFAAIAIVVVAGRLYVCLRIMHKVSIDDYIIILTLVRSPRVCVFKVLTSASAPVARVGGQHILDHIM